ncbi:MAG: hypothetical protein AB7Q00_10835 [Phycisphaerales bacterium]
MRKATLGVAALFLALGALTGCECDCKDTKQASLGAVKADDCGSSCSDKADCGTSCSEGSMGAVKAKASGCCSESKTN